MPLRHQDPTTGRWNGIDPVTHFSSSTYAGYNNNPVYWADPSGANGHSFWGAIKSFFGGGSGGRMVNGRNVNVGGASGTFGNIAGGVGIMAGNAAAGAIADGLGEILDGGDKLPSKLPKNVGDLFKIIGGDITETISDITELITTGKVKARLLWKLTKYLVKEDDITIIIEGSIGKKNFGATTEFLGLDSGLEIKRDVSTGTITIHKKGGGFKFTGEIDTFKQDKTSLSLNGFGVGVETKTFEDKTTKHLFATIPFYKWISDMEMKTIKQDKTKEGATLSAGVSAILGFRFTILVGPKPKYRVPQE